MSASSGGVCVSASTAAMTSAFVLREPSYSDPITQSNSRFISKRCKIVRASGVGFPVATATRNPSARSCASSSGMPG